MSASSQYAHFTPKMGKQEAKTPPEWAEALGITKLVEEEWQGREKVYNSTTHKYEMQDEVEWDRQMDHQTFLRTLYSEWHRTNEHGVQYRTGKKRTYKLPKVVVTEGMVLDVLGDAIGWLPTGEIAWRIFEQMGLFLRLEKMPVQKVRDVLTMLQEQGLVTTQYDGPDGTFNNRYHRIHVEARGDGNSKLWGRTDKVEEWVADRDADVVEWNRRNLKAEAFERAVKVDLTYSHPKRPIFTDEAIDAALDTGQVTLSWTDMEKIIDIVNHPKAP